jgi:hypothetical protein
VGYGSFNAIDNKKVNYIVVVSFTEGGNHNINHPELIEKVNVVSNTPRHG